ncbi:polyketide synthase [Penicillium lagena]|uniref:polyketide synthase n=1 Tax=Penicillium lagena TaxID=94218 RepID=UPI00253FA4D8|nr:polyketide synthase [Penicillium lagena]KAJ5611416.1 polyketide synthase [Penicillium lagena]
MPPIRGCIQGTIVLRDNLFHNMTYEAWKISISAKVDASWNLHLAMPMDLDFLVLISSINGSFGGRAQAYYAAANAFQDALARYRISQGQKAVAIDLGLMVSEGIVAENESLLNSVWRFGHLIEIKEAELIALLDFYCNLQLPLLSRGDSQPMIGLELPYSITAKGVDLHHSIRRPTFSHLFRMGLGRTSSEVGQRSVTTLQKDQLIALLRSIDMKNWFLNELGARITVFDLMGNGPVKQISVMVAEQSLFRQ